MTNLKPIFHSKFLSSWIT